MVIFLDSCFWHNCPKHGYLPKSNLEYWEKKIVRNKMRDIEVEKYYKKIGWKIFRFWEHEINKNLDRAIGKINKFLNDVKISRIRD